MGLNIQFQFHKGTIKPTLIIAVTGLAINFNSIKVRLNPPDVLQDRRAPSNFNSIKVRLNRQQPLLGNDKEQFQFHKGTIKPT